MPLISLARSSPETVQEMSIQQIVSFAGDGKLKDDSECQKELQEYLSLVEAEKLGEYANYCLDDSFADSGFALQDVVNEIGRRLEFKVANGRYRGKRNENGFDGVWRSPTVGSFIVETKTTAAYTITLETIARYREGLISEGVVDQNSAILFVVGRQDTLPLEQQIRGSQFSWLMRVVSIEALLKLMQVNISSNSGDVTAQIHQIFRPIEYTRIDPIVDVVFTTAEDKEEPEEVPTEEAEPKAPNKGSFKADVTPREKMKAKRAQIAAAFSEKYGTKLLARKTALFSDATDEFRVAISVSKRYEDNSYQQYWYAYLQPMRDFMEEGTNSFMIWGCIDKDEAYVIPYEDMERLHLDMNSTDRPDRKQYWHVFIRDLGGPPRMYLPKTKEEIDLTPYRITWE